MKTEKTIIEKEDIHCILATRRYIIYTIAFLPITFENN